VALHDACAEVGLPFAIHLGGHGGVNSTAIASGPTTFCPSCVTAIILGICTFPAAVFWS
jgi:hypothetical protein